MKYLPGRQTRRELLFALGLIAAALAAGGDVSSVATARAVHPAPGVTILHTSALDPNFVAKASGALLWTSARTGLVPMPGLRINLARQAPRNPTFAGLYQTGSDTASGTMQITPNIAVGAERGLLEHEFTHALIAQRYGWLYTPLNEGYAYWAQSAQPRFVTGFSMRQVCGEVLAVPLRSPLVSETYMLSALPFTLAEIEGGAPHANALLRDLVTRPWTDLAWRQYLLESCRRAPKVFPAEDPERWPWQSGGETAGLQAP